MQKRKRLVSLFYFNENIAGKDMFLVPKYLADELDMQGEIVFPIWSENSHLKGEYRGMKLTPIKSNSRFNSTFWSEKEMLLWLILNARKINVLSLYWLNYRNVLFCCIYKLLNRKGITFIKGDVDENIILTLPIQEIRNWKYKLKEILYKAIDIFSVETTLAYEHIKSGAMGKHLSRAVALMHNGVDNQLYTEFKIPIKSLEQKENIMITVGRIGTVQKNSEMILQALDGVNMKGWRFLFVGPVEKEFERKYQKFIKNNPDKVDKVILYGKVNDRRDIWELYNTAKVFVLTSQFEGFPNVFPEALLFGNYIITTKVSSATDITNNQVVGKIIPVGDNLALRKELTTLFDGHKILDDIYTSILSHSNKFVWDKAILDVVLIIKNKLNAKSY